MLKKERKMKKLFFLLVAISLMATGSVCANPGSTKNGSTDKTVLKETTLLVQGSCGMCKKRIEKTAKAIDGVVSATWDSETKKLTFGYDTKKTSPKAISKAIAKVGHDTDKDKAPDDVYKALPGCCQYREK
jgi:Cu(I)/Ag(I) efflux system membrane fusion protein